MSLAKPRRFHVDAWLAWRPGTGIGRVATGGPAPTVYGGTQGGAAVRFDIATGGMAPALYVRATHAPGLFAQSDLAAGVSARPILRLPVRLQAEARATRTGGETEVRPALIAVSGFAPVDLPAGFRLEGYGQAGWVGGRYATGFVDGQARLDRTAATLGGAQVRLGAGAWGGAQRFAGRLDVGPSLTLDLRQGGLPARVTVDYRVPIAGNARPGSGVAVMVATGF